MYKFAQTVFKSPIISDPTRSVMPRKTTLSWKAIEWLTIAYILYDISTTFSLIGETINWCM
jgi:hypothetical protein